MSQSYSRGWSVVPAHRFAPNFVAPRAAVASGALSSAWRTTAVVRSGAPQWRGVQRTAAPLRAPGGRPTSAPARAEVRTIGPGAVRDSPTSRGYGSARTVQTNTVRSAPTYGAVRNQSTTPSTIDRRRQYSTADTASNLRGPAPSQPSQPYSAAP